VSEAVGSVGEEAVRLLRALATQSVAGHGAPTFDDLPSEDTASEDTASEKTASEETGGSDDSHACPTGWCPICQVVQFVRENPDAIAGVAASASSMLTSLRDLIDVATSPKDPS
jgi:hypothetical protein